MNLIKHQVLIFHHQDFDCNILQLLIKIIMSYYIRVILFGKYNCICHMGSMLFSVMQKNYLHIIMSTFLNNIGCMQMYIYKDIYNIYILHICVLFSFLYICIYKITFNQFNISTFIYVMRHFVFRLYLLIFVGVLNNYKSTKYIKRVTIGITKEKKT